MSISIEASESFKNKNQSGIIRIPAETVSSPSELAAIPTAVWLRIEGSCSGRNIVARF